jgi:hypothetical protein
MPKTVAEDPNRHTGRKFGDGHCVALVRDLANLPHTKEWRRGEKVRGSGCPSGTAISTFDQNGTYGNHLDGRSHCGILLAENSDGLLVFDQWVGNLARSRTIRYRGGAGKPVNDGDAYYVIELAIE